MGDLSSPTFTAGFYTVAAAASFVNYPTKTAGTVPRHREKETRREGGRVAAIKRNVSYQRARERNDRRNSEGGERRERDKGEISRPRRTDTLASVWAEKRYFRSAGIGRNFAILAD